jgi:hypothetical protein
MIRAFPTGFSGKAADPRSLFVSKKPLLFRALLRGKSGKTSPCVAVTPSGMAEAIRQICSGSRSSGAESSALCPAAYGLIFMHDRA